MIIIQGNLLSADVDVIAHQVNCQGEMGSGLAKQVREKFPVVYKRYLENYKNNKGNQLGSCEIISVSPRRSVANLYGQDDYGRNGKYTDYEAIRESLESLNQQTLGKKIGLPYLLGCGLGGGDWNIVLEIIEHVFADRLHDIVIVQYNKNCQGSQYRASMCITGQRPFKLYGYNKNNYINIKSAIKDIVLNFYHNYDVRDFYSGGAQGIDMLFTETILELKKDYPDIKDYLILPYEDFGNNWKNLDFSYADLLSYSNSVYKTIVLKQHYESPIDLMNRNNELIKHSDYCLAVYPNSTNLTDFEGGTGQTINQSINKKRPLLILDPFELNLNKNFFYI